MKKYFNRIVLLAAILTGINLNLIAKEIEIPLLTKDKLLWSDYHIYLLDGVKNYDISKTYYDMALQYYRNNDIENAMVQIEWALSYHKHGVYFYLYGDCLADIGEYKNAEQAYKKAIEKNEYINPYDTYPVIKNLFTYDANGIAREIYFAYYNLGCVYSLQNKLVESLEYIILAIQHGYPNINYIFKDDDLLNLFHSADGEYYKNTINKMYKDGFVNNVVNKIFSTPEGWGGHKYEFFENGRVFRDSLDYNSHYGRGGAYEFKNWIIFIHWDSESGIRGVEGTMMRGTSAAGDYTEYESFSNDLDEREIILYQELIQKDYYTIETREPEPQPEKPAPVIESQQLSSSKILRIAKKQAPREQIPWKRICLFIGITVVLAIGINVIKKRKK